MTTGREDLEAIGFERVGHWQLQGDEPQYVLSRWGDAAPALYAFVIATDVMYVGKTVRTLDERLYGYQKGSGTQRTNIRVREVIREALGQGDEVSILGFRDSTPQRLGRFVLNLPAALEDDIIGTLKPRWNGVRNTRRSSNKERAPSAGESGPAATQQAPGTSTTHDSAPERGSRVATFVVRVGKAYFRQGFFNVPIDHTHDFPADGRVVEIQLQRSGSLLRAKVNRRANSNGTPRIMGGIGLRDWFRGTVQIGASIRVRVLGRDRIEISPV